MRRDRVVCRAVTIGDASVGKTSIVGRFIRKFFDPNEANTVGACYDSFTSEYQGHRIQVEIWDTAGQEEYRALAPIYFRNAAAAILVFDLTNSLSFDHIDAWLKSFRDVAGERASALLVGNKTDREGRAVLPSKATEWADAHGCCYIETSAATGDGIKELFARLVAVLAEAKLVDEPRKEALPPAAEPAGGTERKCC
jgi:small GTP-binding protein